jgi:hypothetical protein
MSPHDSSRDLAQWLKETGQRKALKQLRQQIGDAKDERASEEVPKKTRVRWMIYAAILALAYLQYFFADVLLQTNAIRSFFVFLSINGMLPPV